MSKLSRKEITYFSIEELDKKSTQRLLALKKKLYKHTAVCTQAMWSDCPEWCEYDDRSKCPEYLPEHVEVRRQINIINGICKEREHVVK